MKIRLLIAPLFLFALIYPVFAFDVVPRLIGSTVRQDTANFALLLFYEITRGIWLTIMLLLALIAIARADTRRYLAPLALCIVFASLAYGMFFGGGGYAGYLQERMVRSLLDLGLSRRTIATVFTFGLWPLWPAAGALVRFAVQYPEPLSPMTVRTSGAQDRAGVMRSVPGAGLDVGAAFRGLVANGLERRWLDTTPIAIVSCAGALLSMLLRNSGAVAVLWIVPAFGIAIAVTALRAAWSAGHESVRRRLQRLGRGALASVMFLAAAGVLGGIIRIQAGAVLVMMLMTLAPAPLLRGLAGMVLSGEMSAEKIANREEGDERQLDDAGPDLVGGSSRHGPGAGGAATE